MVIKKYCYFLLNMIYCCKLSLYLTLIKHNKIIEVNNKMGNKNTVYLTQQGLDSLKQELDNLINVRRPENVKAIKEARSLGDLSENAEYDAARNEQAEIEGRIKQIEKMLENVSIISDAGTDKVNIGNTVSIKYVDDDEEDEYKIVGSQEADPFESKISNESPIAQALFNHKVGDLVTVESPNGNYQVEIIDIK